MIRHILSQRKIKILFRLFFLIVPIQHLCADSKKFEQTVIFQTDTGNYPVALEIAKTEAQKSKGLMFRKTLADKTGMVFVYDKPTKNVGIWMKNTYIPLDVIFVDCDNVVVDCVTREPHTIQISVPIKKICSIIEVNARFCEKNSLKRNNKVKFIPPLK